MNKRLLNLTLFSAVIIFILSLPIIFVDRYLPQSQHPWQLQPFNADSLSLFYKRNYKVVGDTALINFLDDSSKTVVSILIDGWGVPYDEILLVHDFSQFKENSPKYIIRKRTINITTFAESVEYKKDFINGIFLFGGDLQTCKKKQQNLVGLFSSITCYEKYSDSKMVLILDSLLAERSWSRIAWTTFDTREGDREKLFLLLASLAKLAKQYPQIQFIIQGTHRPILGAPETRRKYLAPWVPAVILNIMN